MNHEKKKGLAVLQVEGRKEELSTANLLFSHFGPAAFDLLDTHHTGLGYSAGVERLTGLVREGKFSMDEFSSDPVTGIADFLRGYFTDRGGNQPEVWFKDNTVFLKTELDAFCPTIEAENLLPQKHRDICNVYCRSFAKGMLKIFEDLVPGLQINFYNLSSKRSGGDCVEAFQVVHP